MARIQVKRGTAAEWADANPILAAGEVGFETDTNIVKLGNGTDAWADLEAINSAPTAVAAGAGGGVMTIDLLDAGVDQTFGAGKSPHYTAYFHTGSELIVDHMTAWCSVFVSDATVELGIYNSARQKISSGTVLTTGVGRFNVALAEPVTLETGELYYFAILNQTAVNNGYIAELTDIRSGTDITFIGAAPATELPAVEASLGNSNRGIWLTAWKA